MKKIKLHHYGYKRALFDTKSCKEGFVEDRKNGLIYGPYFLESLNRWAIDAEEFSRVTKTCPYCGAKEGDLV